MLTKLKNILEKKEPISNNETEDKIAISALLIEAAMIDGELSDSEKETILRLLSTYFNLSAEETDYLFLEASKIQENQSQILNYTRAIKENFPEEDRIKLIQMLWEVVQADGIEDSFETNLIRRIAGLIYVKDFDSGLARKRAQKNNN